MPRKEARSVVLMMMDLDENLFPSTASFGEEERKMTTKSDFLAVCFSAPMYSKVCL